MFCIVSKGMCLMHMWNEDASCQVFIINTTLRFKVRCLENLTTIGTTIFAFYLISILSVSWQCHKTSRKNPHTLAFSLMFSSFHHMADNIILFRISFIVFLCTLYIFVFLSVISSVYIFFFQLDLGWIIRWKAGKNNNLTKCLLFWISM